MVIFWVALAGIFAIWLNFQYGSEIASQFVSGYLVEKSLSVDNLFVFSLIFQSFGILPKDQSRYLNWGIIGAFIFRGIFIAVGAAALEQWHWLLYFAGAFLIYTSVKLLNSDDEPEIHPMIEKVTKNMPLFWAVVISIEFSDILFALDSVPATFAVTQNPLVVYSSNMFAILGLRSLYFVLVDMLDKFHLLNKGVSIVLGFIGIKIMIAEVVHISTPIALMVTATILAASVYASFLFPKTEEAA